MYFPQIIAVAIFVNDDSFFRPFISVERESEHVFEAAACSKVGIFEEGDVERSVVIHIRGYHIAGRGSHASVVLDVHSAYTVVVGKSGKIRIHVAHTLIRTRRIEKRVTFYFDHLRVKIVRLDQSVIEPLRGFGLRGIYIQFFFFRGRGITFGI